MLAVHVTAVYVCESHDISIQLGEDAELNFTLQFVYFFFYFENQNDLDDVFNLTHYDL